jgi:hypothetical protein
MEATPPPQPETPNSTPTGQGFTVDMSKQPLLYPAHCPNHHPVPDPSDETAAYQAYICHVCKRGFLKRKS